MGAGEEECNSVYERHLIIFADLKLGFLELNLGAFTRKGVASRYMPRLRSLARINTPGLGYEAKSQRIQEGVFSYLQSASPREENEEVVSCGFNSLGLLSLAVKHHNIL